MKRTQPQARRQRGMATRQRLIDIATSAFAEYGYDGTGTRLLADRARVNLPAIAYHFGGKEGLYRAVIEDIARSIADQMAPIGSRIEAALANRKLPRSELLELLTELLDSFVVMVFESHTRGGPKAAESRKLFIARAEIENAPALEILYDTMRKAVGQPCAAVIARLTGRAPRDETTLLRSVAMLGQVTVFCNKPALRTLGWRTMKRAHLQAVQRIAREQTRAIFAAEVRR